MATNYYQSKFKKSPDNNYRDVLDNANQIFRKIEVKTKRRPYVRSVYFRKEKIFFDYFWRHVFQKAPKERVERLRYFEASIDLIKNSRISPDSKINQDKKSEILHRFYGRTKDKNEFCVQVKEDIKTKRKYFMSCFPWKE